MIELIFLKEPYRADRAPNANFLAVKHNKEIYPLHYQDDKKETFIMGFGYVKIAKKQLFTVPVYSRKVKDWDTYLEKYGKYCLYYSLSGGHLEDRDCCTIRQQEEFYRILHCGGAVKFSQFANNFNKFHKIQEDVIEKLPGICKLYSDDIYIKPAYSISILGCAPYMDSINDDRKLEKTYLYIRKHNLKQAHRLNDEYAETSKAKDIAFKEMKRLENINCSNVEYWKMRDKFDELKDQSWNLYCKIDAEITDIALKEIGAGKVFPICMKDRMSFLFGEEAVHHYINCMEIYK
jgi:hypothetical protein